MSCKDIVIADGAVPDRLLCCPVNTEVMEGAMCRTTVLIVPSETLNGTPRRRMEM